MTFDFINKLTQHILTLNRDSHNQLHAWQNVGHINFSDFSMPAQSDPSVEFDESEFVKEITAQAQRFEDSF